LQTYKTKGGAKNKQAAILHLKKSLAYWDSIVNTTSFFYKEMPLVHLSQQGGKESPENFYKKFHWKSLRAEVAKDLEMAEALK